MKPYNGYIYTKEKVPHFRVTVYLSVADLRLQCGEVPASEILQVEVREVESGT